MNFMEYNEFKEMETFLKEQYQIAVKQALHAFIFSQPLTMPAL
jgi:hypothetical protein